jgi:ribose-phosphate pyrophosphokinase
MESNDLMNFTNKGPLAIIAMESCKELGQKIDDYLLKKRYGYDKNDPEYKGEVPESFLIPINEVRFSNGEGKVIINKSVRGKDVYVLCDVGNYSCTYDMFGFKHNKAPDEHFQDIKRVLSAIGGRAKKVSVIMPLLYSGRQHKRKGRESMDCAIALQELERLGVDEILTFDAHDPNVQNAIPLLSFVNLYPTYDIVKSFIKEENGLFSDNSKMLVISPDTGAMDRAIYYSGVLGLDIGLFYKRRDHSKVVNGKNPIVQHEYIGRDVEGQDILIIDDMISSGQSILDIAKELKSRKANNIFIATTFSFFTEGTEMFDEYYKQGYINKIYTTNLSYLPKAVTNSEWFSEVDMTEFISNIIDTINCERSIKPLLNATASIKKLLDQANINNKPKNL